MNDVTEQRNQTFKDMMKSMEVLKTAFYIIYRVPSKGVNKISYELWIGKKIKYLHIWGYQVKARPHRPHERKLGSRIVSCYFVGYVKRSQNYKFYYLTSRSLFETRNSRFVEEVEFGKEENIRKVDFEEEFVNDIGQVLVPITIQETTSIIEDNA
ncbi:hypothetical protein CR513_47332, partial [Mucuna pruriens]